MLEPEEVNFFPITIKRWEKKTFSSLSKSNVKNKSLKYEKSEKPTFEF